MMRKLIVLVSLIVTGIFISGFSGGSKDENIYVNFDNKVSTVFPSELDTFNEYSVPFVGKSFNGFKEAIAFKESQGKYHVVNSLGYLGKYQFGKSTLKRFNIYNTQLFLNSAKTQEDAFVALCSLNKWILRKDIKRSVGKKINGIEITESGILAAAHLAGAGNVKKYLRSHGRNTFKDAYGSTVQHYLKKFSGYDTSIIEANKKPVV